MWKGVYRVVAETTEAPVGLRSERGAILGSLMLATSLIALDSTIIATAVLTITEGLGGFAQFPWLFSVYLLTHAVSVPIYGKVADTVGRKPVILFAIALFAFGSLLCGLAQNMLALIIFRAVQGLGAGGITPMTNTIAADLYTLPERAKVQGYMASVWAMSSVAGPLLGGIIAESIGWRWIFLINIPLAAWAALMLLRHFTETAPRHRQRIDYPGVVLLTLGAGAVILGLLEGGRAWAWKSSTSLGIFIAGTVLLALFVAVEHRSANPLLPLWLFTRRVVVGSCLVAVLVGVLLLGLTSYVPTFTQSVLGSSAVAGGLTLGALLLGWPLAGALAGRVYLSIGFRRTALVGATITAAGAASTLLIGMGSALWQIALSCFVIGLGLGLISTPTLIAGQTSAVWNERGVVTSANGFARAIGSAVGVAVFGALVNSRVHGNDTPSPQALADGVHLVFLVVTAMAIPLLVGAALMPGRRARPH